MRTVLVAEDEISIREFIVINLKIAGFNVIEASDGDEAKKIYNENINAIDVAVLDVMMPGADGFEVCAHIREKNPNVGIIFLTAKAQEQDKINGFNHGADDYVPKPFSPAELIARIETLYRRVEYSKALLSASGGDIIRIGDYTLNLKKHTVLNGDKETELTQTEVQILECFFTNPGTLIDRKQILDRVWGSPYYGDDKVVDVNIRRLRIKLEENPSDPRHLITVWGQGYCWKE